MQENIQRQKDNGTFFKQYRIAVIVSFLVFGCVLVGALWFVSSSGLYSKSDPEYIKVRLGWVHQAQFAGMYVAEELGLYRQNGLDVELLGAVFDVDPIDELRQNEIDISIMEAHQFLSRYQEHQDLLAIAVIYKTNPHALAVRKDSDIMSPEDFGGKTVGFAGGQSEGTALFELFIGGATKEDPVSYVALGFNTVEDFQNKRADIIDVYAVDQPYLAQRNGIPLRIIDLSAFGIETYGDVIVVTKSFAEKNPNLVRSFVQATLEGWKYALENPAEAVPITLQYTQNDYADEKYQEFILFNSTPLIYGDSKDIGFMQSIPWSVLYEFMKKAGVITIPFPIQEAYTNDFMRL